MLPHRPTSDYAKRLSAIKNEALQLLIQLATGRMAVAPFSCGDRDFAMTSRLPLI